jgi:DNA-binding MarR family transcriptional regulator
MDLIARVILFNHLVAQREGLGTSDGQFLQLLRLHGPMTAGQLAEMTGLTTGSTTGVIDRLERAGLAHRTRDANDRRKVIVVPDDEAIGTRLMPHYTGQAERLDTVLRTRSAQELRVIADFLAELTSGPIAP